MRSLAIIMATMLVTGCVGSIPPAPWSVEYDRYQAYPAPLPGCFFPGNAVVSVNGRTCVGLGYPPPLVGGFIIRR